MVHDDMRMAYEYAGIKYERKKKSGISTEMYVLISATDVLLTHHNISPTGIIPFTFDDEKEFHATNTFNNSFKNKI